MLHVAAAKIMVYVMHRSRAETRYWSGKRCPFRPGCVGLMDWAIGLLGSLGLGHAAWKHSKHSDMMIRSSSCWASRYAHCIIAQLPDPVLIAAFRFVYAWCSFMDKCQGVKTPPHCPPHLPSPQTPYYPSRPQPSLPLYTYAHFHLYKMTGSQYLSNNLLHHPLPTDLFACSKVR